MKIFIVGFITYISIFSSAHSQITDSTFALSGKIIGSEDNYYVYLSHTDDGGNYLRDSCLLVNNIFNFSGVIRYPTRFSLRGKVKSVADDDPNSVAFYLDPGKNYNIKLQYGNLKKISIENSQSQKDWVEFHKPTSNYRENAIVFADVNRSSFVSPFAISLYKSAIPLDSVRILYQNLDVSVQNSLEGRNLKKYLDSRHSSDIGKKIEDFSAVDINMKPIKLSMFSGKCILLDFWASWCGPCRKENPELKKVYNKYKNLGFDIIGVSSDDSSDKWRAAVKKDGLPWHHVLSGYDAKNISSSDPIGKKYGITALPTFIVVDENGVVLDRFVGSGGVEKLDNLLKIKYKLD